MEEVLKLLVLLAAGVIVLFVFLLGVDRDMRKQGRKSRERRERDGRVSDEPTQTDATRPGR